MHGLDLTLFYRGLLRAARNPDPKDSPRRQHKHDIRLKFDPQLRRRFGNWQGDPAVVRHGDCVLPFYAYATKDNLFLVRLDILMLRPQPPGHVISGGDIDNRIKTLLDALCVPQVNQLPDTTQEGLKRIEQASPVHCLMQDDNLITDVRISTDTLLDVDPNSEDVVLVIKAELHTRNPVTWVTGGPPGDIAA